MTIEEYITNNSEPEDTLLTELSRETHLKVLMPRMLSGHIQGKLLEHFSKMIKPVNILELGTYTGYSAICLSKGLQKNGKLHTIELNEELEEIASKYFQKSNLTNKIKQYFGNALKIIPKLDIKFDLVFIDADKREYPQYYKAIIDKVNPGGYIIADNVLWNNKVIEDKKLNDLYTKGVKYFNKFVNNDPKVENFILPLRDGLMILRKK